MVVEGGFSVRGKEEERGKGVTPQIRDVTGQRQTYTYAFEALTY